MKKKYIKIISYLGISLLLISLIFIGTFFLTSYSPTVEALANLEDSSTVDVTATDDLLVFTPENTTAKTGLIIYPGAKVEPESYAPLANKIAEAGFEVIITPMPLNFAIFNANAADDVIEEFPHIKNWAISGHSLGGVMAAKYASEHPTITGLILYASYPQGDELKESNIQVTSIYASNDGVANIDKILNSRNLLPVNSTFIKIEGGNHAQFGNYGEQKGDNPSTISDEEQMAITSEASIKLLNSITK